MTSGALQQTAAILEHERVARDTYRLRLAAPAIAQAIRPGQFVMMRPAAEPGTDPLLGRAFALYDVARDADGRASAFDVVFLTMGKGTRLLSRKRPGDDLSLWGPLGNGFGPAPSGTVILAAGGIGQTPFLALARWWLGQADYGEERAEIRGARPDRIDLLYGVRSADLLAGVADFERAGVRVETATDDGSAGHHGFVTDLLERRLSIGERPAKIVACGPVPMLKAVAKIAIRHQVPAEVSLENHMACGFGACFSCVAPIRMPNGDKDLRRVCVDGPVFPADQVIWDAD